MKDADRGFVWCSDIEEWSPREIALAQLFTKFMAIVKRYVDADITA
jgi:hypothetical protein